MTAEHETTGDFRVPPRGWRESADCMWMPWRKHKRLVRKQCLAMRAGNRAAFRKVRP